MDFKDKLKKETEFDKDFVLIHPGQIYGLYKSSQPETFKKRPITSRTRSVVEIKYHLLCLHNDTMTISTIKTVKPFICMYLSYQLDPSVYPKPR